MSWISRTVIRACLAGVVGVALVATSVPAQAATDEYVKYYTVTSAYQGAPENLAEIANRFLGSGSRAAEIFELNTGRKQPDGKALADQNQLHAGWLLVMPWDAVGAGIQYGVLPDGTKPETAKADAPAKGQPAPGSIPAPGSRPEAGPGLTLPSQSSGVCASVAASSSTSDWARLRLAADKAWPQSRGKGQVVAIIDSGANGATPQLAGHVAVGMDIVQTGQRGDTDCLGTGTSMAALVVATQVNGEGPVGVAPDATIMPVRIVTNRPTAVTTAVQVKAIEAAVSAGATVIALGSFVNASNAEVAKAIATAVSKNVVVVLGSPTAATPVDPAAKTGKGALRVAGVGVDDKWAVDYRKGAVDVVAPGVNVSSLSGTAPTGAKNGTAGNGAVTGSGTHFAVAFAAAEAALVRSAYPDLSAEQVTERIKATADRMGSGEPPHRQYGWGFLNPGEAVTKVLADEAKAAAPPVAAGTESSGAALDSAAQNQPSSGKSRALLIVTVLLMLVAALWLSRRIWRLFRRNDVDDYAVDVKRESDIDLYDPRFRSAAPVMASNADPGRPAGGGPGPPGPPPAGTSLAGRDPFDDGGEDHWSQVGGHWSDPSLDDAPEKGPGPAGGPRGDRV